VFSVDVQPAARRWFIPLGAGAQGPITWARHRNARRGIERHPVRIAVRIAVRIVVAPRPT